MRFNTMHFNTTMKKTSYLSKIILALLALIALSVNVRAQDNALKSKYLVYVGTYTQQEGTGKGIYVYRFDAASGQLAPLGVAVETTNPSFLAVHPNHRFLYAVNDVADYKGKKSGIVSAFVINRKNGKLTLLNEVPSAGAGPCYITLDKTGKFVLVANYTGGSVAAFPVLQDGRLGEASAFVQHAGHGANPQRQEGPHPHYIDLSSNNHFAVTADLGLDEILVYKFDPTKGTLTPNDPKFASVEAGAGPRHFVFHPDGKFGYVINEMQSSITAFSYDSDHGVLHKLQTISTLPKDFAGSNDDAEIEVHPSGKFLYASNRGHDSIAVFAIDQSTGTLTLVEHVPTQGKTPRNFELDRSVRMTFAESTPSTVASESATRVRRPTGT